MTNKLMILTGPLGGHGGEETIISHFINETTNYYIDLIVTEMIGDILWVDPVKSKLRKLVVNTNNNKFVKVINIIKQLLKTDVNGILCLTPKMVIVAWIVRICFFKKYKIISWMQFSINDKFNFQTAKFLKKANANLAISSGIAEQLSALGIVQTKIFTIFNPVVKHERIIKVDNSTTRFIYIARIQFKGEKNLQELLSACAYLTGSWQLDIYGADLSENKIESKLCKAYINDLNITSHINWMGWKDDVWTNVKNADCLVLTSRAEGFGMVLCEAVSYGIPVVSSNCPTGPIDIVNENNGFLYEMGDVQNLAVLLQGFINNTYKFKSDVVKKSISYLYKDEYDKRINRAIKRILSPNYL